MKPSYLLVLVLALALCPALAQVATPVGSRAVSAADFDDWIYNVPAGVLECRGDALLFRAGGTAYALNRAALTQGYPPALPLVDERELIDYQFAQYLVRWRQQWQSGDAAARQTYGPAMVEATAPKSLLAAARALCG